MKNQIAMNIIKTEAKELELQEELKKVHDERILNIGILRGMDIMEATMKDKIKEALEEYKKSIASTQVRGPVPQ